MNIHIQTEKFIIRDIEEDDLEGMYDLDSNPRVHKYLGGNPIKTKDQARDIIKNIREQYDTNGIGRWAIEDLKTNEFIGWTGFKHETKLRPDRAYIDIGYRLREKFWGKGIATETGLACINHGFEVLKYKNVFGCAEVEHTASNIVLQKIGLTYIEDFKFEDHDLHWYGLTNRQWASAQI